MQINCMVFIINMNLSLIYIRKVPREALKTSVVVLGFLQHFPRDHEKNHI